MATEKQIAANRRNAEKSTGPRTPEGKARCARNALKHGLAAASAHAFLSVEDRRAFDKMLEGALLAFAPQHADEVELLVERGGYGGDYIPPDRFSVYVGYSFLMV